MTEEYSLDGGEADALKQEELLIDEDTEGCQPSTSSSSLPSPSSSSQLSVAERNQAFLDSLNEPQGKRSAEDDIGSYIEDLEMFDRDLVLLPTKDLNQLMKRKNIPKERRDQIKQRRRTLKNRGYAAGCRGRMFDEEEDLLERISGDRFNGENKVGLKNPFIFHFDNVTFQNYESIVHF